VVNLGAFIFRCLSIVKILYFVVKLYYNQIGLSLNSWVEAGDPFLGWISFE